MQLTKPERHYNGKAMRNIKRILDLGRSEAEKCTCSNCELTHQESEAWEYACHIAFWIIVLGAFVLIAGCFLPKKAHASSLPSKPNCFDICPGTDEVNFKKCFMYCLRTSGEAIK